MKYLSPVHSIAVVGALALLGAACGSDTSEEAAPVIVVESAEGTEQDTDTDTETESGTEAATAGTDEEQALAFADCMRGEGIDFPDPQVSADGSVDFGFGAGGGGDGEGGFAQDDGFADAVEACGDLIDGASFLPSEGDFTELEDTFLAAAECLREEGIDVGDPDFGGGAAGGGGGPFGADFDPDDPATAAAIEACEDVFTDLGAGRGN